MTDDDAVLVERAKADPEAFGELYQRYLGRIYSYIYYRTGNVHDAEDLTERVFLQALTHFSSYTHRGLPFSVWLFRIAHNMVANWYRDRRRSKVLPLEDLVTAAQDMELPENMEEVAQVRRAVARLTLERQQLLLLRFVEELPHVEIGRIMGRSEGAVKALLHRTLKSLKKELQVTTNGNQDGSRG